MTSTVIEACHGSLPDDATVLCLDWHSTQPPPAYTAGGAPG